ncbi:MULTISPECIES: phosphoglucosamine mutase [Haloferax]|uniref:Phosphoglucosamine mutase n=1 Tax=Haloferax massiliensis TaxID=1476858 RepID=A0A0D6JVJ0_9EURY|nr:MULTISPECIES: phosphoglucosamine mutase [Haloferax]MDS0242490.1 phosphoglucosamine mutase [Haloferax sp. S2CR25]MDS0445611.1 phosphoglucosamine mutase [Haloferax sp. S2CR25-2]CQR52921.1 Phosphoglucosamine mutase [Haloferax massiliensis]
MFGTSGVRGPVGEGVTAELTLSIGRALGSEVSGRVVVGRDARESGTMLEHAFVAGLMECGADVIRLGTQPTPSIARAVEWFDADAGAVITASHNPPTDNGVKLWAASGRAFDADRRAAIERRIENEDYQFAAWDGVGSERRRCVEDRHRDALTSSVDLDDTCSVVVDIGNGTGRLTADALSDLGCTVSTLNGQRDGRFPARPSEPTDETLRGLQAHVAATDASLGIAHDGDADRMMAVDGDGNFVDGDTLLALFGREAASEGDRIAVPVNTSLAVDDAVATVGADAVRTRVGDVFVAEKCAEPGVVFGGEPSGAWIWADETPCPDGPLAACKLVEFVSRRGPLADLVDGVDSYPLRRESVETTDKTGVLDRVESAVREEYDDVDIDDRDGLRVETDEGWFLIRASGTQPLVRVTAEARTETATDRLFDEALTLVESCADTVPA